jgi:hypothetical protein
MFINKGKTEAHHGGAEAPRKTKKKGDDRRAAVTGPIPAKSDWCFHAAITEVTESTEIRLGVACES